MHKTESTQHIALWSEEDRATATVNMYKHLVKFGRVVVEIR